MYAALALASSFTVVREQGSSRVVSPAMGKSSEWVIATRSPTSATTATASARLPRSSNFGAKFSMAFPGRCVANASYPLANASYLLSSPSQEVGWQYLFLDARIHSR